MKIVNPATEEIIEDVPVDSKESLQHSFQLLQQGQISWATVNMEERINCLRLFSNLLEKNKTSLATTLSAETGKPLQQAANEISGARTRIKWLCDHAKQYLQEEIMSQDEKMLEKITYEPLGVICNISAWNYPYLVGVNVYVPALIAGNAVMYKPSEYATLTGIEIDKLLKQAGIPENVFQLAIGAGDIGAALLEMPFDGYFFTGSYATGKNIYEKVAQKMVPCQL
jgi:acyl-CoA reductase-like NAD-dependent aldehyde dehydrogenase